MRITQSYSSIKYLTLDKEFFILSF